MPGKIVTKIGAMPRPRTGQTPKHNVRVPDELWDRALLIAGLRGETMTKVVRDGLVSYIEAYGHLAELPKAPE